MNVMLNGERSEIDPGVTVAALVDRLLESPKGVAIAVNEEVVPRSQWRDVELQADDRVEVLTASKGG